MMLSEYTEQKYNLYNHLDDLMSEYFLWEGDKEKRILLLVEIKEQEKAISNLSDEFLKGEKR